MTTDADRSDAQAPPPPTATPRSQPRAWAFLALLFLVPFPSIAIIDGIHFNWNGVTTVFFAFAKFWILLVPLAWTLLVDKAPLSWSPPSRGRGGWVPGLGLGIAGAVVILLGFMVIRPMINVAGVHEMATRARISSPATFIAAAAYWCLINSLLEEYVWRWFVFVKLETLLGPGAKGWAGVLAALCFTAHHFFALTAYINLPLALLGSAAVFTAGLAWSALYARYRSVWPGYVAHAMADAAIFLAAWPLLFPRVG